MTSTQCLLLMCIFLSHHITVNTLSPDAPNVCLFDENYVQKVESRELMPVKVTRIQWCMKMPPRCIVEDTEMRWQTVTKEVPRMRLVAKCCAGYAADLNDTKCMAVCSQPCVHGVCASPDNCTCESGYMGIQCRQKCPDGRWGRSCVEECDCEHSSACGSINGDCSCLPGWQGIRCELPCYEGSFGAFCGEICNCNGELCNHITGFCILPSTTTTSTTTTTTSTTVTTLNAASMTVTEAPLSDLRTTTVNSVWPRNTTRVRAHNTSTTAVVTTSENPVRVTEDLDVRINNSGSTRKNMTSSRPEGGKKNHTEGKKEFNQIIKNSRERTRLPQGGDAIKTQVDDTEIDLEWIIIPTLIGVLSLVLLVFTCSMGFLMLSHYTKARQKDKRLAVTAKQEFVRPIARQDIGIHKFYGEGVLPVKTVFENPVYSSMDADTEEDPRQQTQLMSFKTPTDSPRVQSLLEAHYDHPPSNRTTAEPTDEPFYDEISVCQNYDIPRLSFCRVSVCDDS